VTFRRQRVALIRTDSCQKKKQTIGYQEEQTETETKTEKQTMTGKQSDKEKQREVRGYMAVGSCKPEVKPAPTTGSQNDTR